jgi:hypothetical protein
MFRVSRSGSDQVTDVTQVDEIEPAVRAEKAGRWHVDEISAVGCRQTTVPDVGASPLSAGGLCPIRGDRKCSSLLAGHPGAMFR